MVICKNRSMGGSKLCQWIVLLCVLGSFGAESYPVEITYVESAVKKGAVCLDGSPPAYHLSPGFGDGSDNWLIRLEGGAWCDNTRSCLRRRDGRLGSSKKMVKTLQYSGMFGNLKRRNPDFYNWNKVKVRYCDGASFTGDIEAVDSETKLHYRGARVFQAVMDDLLEKGMKHAKMALFTGCSAGGLAAILHCDNFRSLLPSSAKVKCLSDAGYFINVRDITGSAHIERYFKNVVNTHGSAKNLPSSCTSRRKAGLCFFPENMAKHIKTPLFILNSAYDSWQTRNILVPRSADRDGTWKKCRTDITKCSSSQLTIMQGFRKSFLRALGHGGTQSSRGFFIDSCYVHCQIGTQSSWLGKYAPKLNNKPLGKVVGDWFYDRQSFQKIDCPYPCNKTCKNRVYGMSMFPEEIDI